MRFRVPCLLTSIAIAAACSDSTPKATTDPIDIGSLVSLTGALGGTGQDNRDAANLAFEQINAAGGVLGRPIRVSVVDDLTTIDGARAGYSKLLEQRVTAIIGPSSSSQTVGVADLIASGRTLTFGRTASSPLISSLPDDDFYFRLAPSDQFQAKVVTEILKNMGLEKICLVHREDTYGTNLADALEKEIAGTPPITRARYNPNDADLSGVLRTCDPLLCSSGGGDAGAPGGNCSADDKVGLVMVTYVTDGKAILEGAPGWSATKQHFFFTDGARDVELLNLGLPKEKLQGARGTIPSGPDPKDKDGDLLVAYRGAYQTRYNTPAPRFSHNAFDAAYLIAAAIEVAGTTERVAVRDALRKVNTEGGTPVGVGNWTDIKAAIARKQPIDLRGAGGSINFDANGDITAPFYYGVWKIDNGASADDGTYTVQPDGTTTVSK